MKVLVTGVAGFIGSFLAERLVKRGDEVVGLDNLNAYYPVSLKLDRLKRLGIKEVKASAFVTSTIYANLRFIQMDLADREGLWTGRVRHRFIRSARAMATAASTTTAPRSATQASWRPRISSASTRPVVRL